MTNLADVLRAKRGEIVEAWLRRIRRENSPVDLSSAELRDHLPTFFGDLIDALEHRDEPRRAESTLAASRHGEQRLHVGFDVDQVIREYDILGQTILEIADAAGVAISIAQTRILIALLDAGRSEAVAAYVRRRDEQAKREADEHVSFVAHELRNALNTITLAHTGLKRTLLNPGGRLVDMLERGVRTIRELVDQVLTAARFPHTPLRMERVSIRDVVGEVVQELAPKAEHKDIAMRVETDGDVVVEADRRLLHSVAANLIGNAIKFTRPGAAIVVRAATEDGGVIVDFEDSCGGLPEGETEDLFQPYVQRGKDRSGLGLGLAIVKQAVEAHAGTVELTNRPGNGCRFRLRLPIRQAAR
jgi:signal transduction histidine kinase